MQRHGQDEILKILTLEDFFISMRDEGGDRILGWVRGRDFVEATLPWSPERVDAVVLTNGYLKFKEKEGAPKMPRGSVLYHSDHWKEAQHLPHLTQVGRISLGNRMVPLMAAEAVCY